MRKNDELKSPTAKVGKPDNTARPKLTFYSHLLCVANLIFFVLNVFDFFIFCLENDGVRFHQKQNCKYIPSMKCVRHHRG